MATGNVRTRVARVLLMGFDRAEVDDIVADLQELAAERGPLSGAVYFWTELCKYPLRQTVDGLFRGTARDAFSRDLRYGIRSLTRSGGFAGMAVVLMTLSMGSATAIFSVVDGVLLEPLPVEEPDALMSLWLTRNGTRGRMTPGNAKDVEGLDGVFSHVATFRGQTSSLLIEGSPVFLRGGAVTSEYFETLGVRPLLGRDFAEGEDEAGAPPVVVLSHHAWQQTFGGDPQILGRQLSLDDELVEVIGVAPPGLYPTQATVAADLPLTSANQDFFIPLRFGAEAWSNRRSHVLGMIARLDRGRTPESARAALAALSARLQETEPLNQGESVLMTSFRDEVVGNVRFGLLTLLGTIVLVLTIAVVNVGALFVLRAADRRPELSIRRALGASKSRLLRQLLIESTLIVSVAAVGAVAVAWGILGAIKRLVPYQIPRLNQVDVDATTLLVTVAISMVAAVAFGLAPALLLSRGTGEGGGQGRGQTWSRGQRRLQSGVVAVQASLGVVVLIGAALLTRSYAALRAVDTGFDGRDTWVMSIPAPLPVLDEIATEVRRLPGIAAASVAYDHPLRRSWGDSYRVEGVELLASERAPSASLRPFGEQYFAAAGIEVVEGRVPEALDMAGPVAYAVINETLRNEQFPGGGALGSRIVLPTAQRMGLGEGVFEVMGVVRDVRFLGPDQPTGAALYVPLSHFPVGATVLLVRPEREGIDVAGGVRRVVRETDSGLAVQRAERLRDVLADLLARPRFNMVLLITFGAMGLGLCALGAYGLVARVVSMRFREIGIRMALGANRMRLGRSVMGSALRPMLVGGLLGLVASLVLARVIRSLLFGTSPTDPVSFAVSTVFVLVVGCVAALGPTLRALAIEPASTLREE